MPRLVPWGKFDYMGVVPLGASRVRSSKHFQAVLLDDHQQLQSHAARFFSRREPVVSQFEFLRPEYSNHKNPKITRPKMIETIPPMIDRNA